MGTIIEKFGKYITPLLIRLSLVKEKLEGVWSFNGRMNRSQKTDKQLVLTSSYSIYCASEFDCRRTLERAIILL